MAPWTWEWSVAWWTTQQWNTVGIITDITGTCWSLRYWFLRRGIRDRDCQGMPGYHQGPFSLRQACQGSVAAVQHYAEQCSVHVAEERLNVPFGHCESNCWKEQVAIGNGKTWAEVLATARLCSDWFYTIRDDKLQWNLQSHDISCLITVECGGFTPLAQRPDLRWRSRVFCCLVLYLLSLLLLQRQICFTFVVVLCSCLGDGWLVWLRRLRATYLHAVAVLVKWILKNLEKRGTKKRDKKEGQ